jgi:hypothetical protein
MIPVSMMNSLKGRELRIPKPEGKNAAAPIAPIAPINGGDTRNGNGFFGYKQSKLGRRLVPVKVKETKIVMETNFLWKEQTL